jgi:hypothetical protein
MILYRPQLATLHHYLKTRFAREIARDARGFKQLVLRLIRRELPPRRGRPNDPGIDAVVRMAEQGKTIKEILRSQIHDFDRMDTYGRYLAEKGLRTAIERRHPVSQTMSCP